MGRKICRQCGNAFNYCRSCTFKPIPWKDAGFCSRECSAEYKNKTKEVIPTEDVEVVVIEEDTSTPTENAIEYPYFFTEVKESEITSTEEFKPKKKRIKTIEVGQKENNINENEQNNGPVI